MKINEITNSPNQWQWQLAYEIDQHLDAGDLSIVDGVNFDIFSFDVLCFLLRLGKKTASILIRKNKTKMSDILSCTPGELLFLPGLGRRAFEQIVNGLARLDKTLTPHEQPQSQGSYE